MLLKGGGGGGEGSPERMVRVQRRGRICVPVNMCSDTVCQFVRPVLLVVICSKAVTDLSFLVSPSDRSHPCRTSQCTCSRLIWL